MSDREELIEGIRRENRPLSVTEICHIMGWKATLSYSSDMRDWLNQLVDEGVLDEVIVDHRIMYLVKEE